MFNLDLPHLRFRHGPKQIDIQQPIFQPRRRDLYPFGQYKRPLELAGGNPSVQEHPAPVVAVILAADDQLVVFDFDVELIHREPGDRQGNPKMLLADLFDVIRRIAFI